MLAQLLDTVSLDESRVPGLGHLMGLELAEQLVQCMFILLSQVVFEEVDNVQQEVCVDPPFTVRTEHGKVIRVGIDRTLRVRKATCWAGFP